MTKILAVTHFNSGEALVLDLKPDLIYNKYNDTTIIGTDGLFYQCYGYEAPTRYSKAFGGSQFDIILSDGSIEHCNGQWWGSVTKYAKEIIGIDYVEVTCASIQSLQRFYVFSKYLMNRDDYIALRKTYTGTVYGYWDFETELKNGFGTNKET